MATASPVPVHKRPAPVARRWNTGCGWSAWLGLAGLIILLDQASKWVALDALRIGETRYFAPFWNWVLTA